MDQQARALHGQHHAPPRPRQEWLPDQILQPLHLHAQGGLAAADPAGGAAERAGLRDAREAAQQIDVEAQCHQRS